MKFLHLADLHLGRSLGEFRLLPDQRYILEQILCIAKERAVDAVLIAGDVYDKPVPGEEAVQLLDWFLCKLSEYKIRTFLISGNHDSDERLNFGSRLFEANGLCIAAKYEGSLCRRQMEDEYGKVNVYLLPFVKASQVRHYFPDEKINSYEDAVRTVFKHAQISPGERNLLVAHQFVAGKGTEPLFGGSESAAAVNVGLVEKICSDCFEAFDYVALGHIHSSQQAGRGEIRYAGSPLKYSLSEIKNDKSVLLVTLREKGFVCVESVPLKPLRDMRHLKGSMAQLLDKQNIRSPKDFIYATLTDEEIVDDAMGIFQQYYPNTVKIDYDNRYTAETEQTDLTRITQKKSFAEWIADFYFQMYGCEIGAEEMAVLKEAAGEAGVMDETA